MQVWLRARLWLLQELPAYRPVLGFSAAKQSSASRPSSGVAAPPSCRLRGRGRGGKRKPRTLQGCRPAAPCHAWPFPPGGPGPAGWELTRTREGKMATGSRRAGRQLPSGQLPPGVLPSPACTPTASAQVPPAGPKAPGRPLFRTSCKGEGERSQTELGPKLLNY